MQNQDNGLGPITVNQGALVETLIQLSNFRQYDMAETLLEACSREQLELLHVIADRAFSVRLTYSLEKRLKCSDAADKIKNTLLAVLIKVLNTWCTEGHRSAIRSVLLEMKPNGLAQLARFPGLDREVYSMLHEYELPDDCFHCNLSQ